MTLVMLTGLITTHCIFGQTWLDNPYFGYRMPIVINNSTGTELTEFQVQVTLGSSFPWAHANADISDFRFTAPDGETLIPYWIESFTQYASATIWVEVPTLAAGTSTTIYLYYGNASITTSASSGDDTFDFFDDFEGTVLSTKWNPLGAGSAVLNGGYLTLNSTGVFDVSSNTGFDFNFISETRGSHPTHGTTGLASQIGFWRSAYNIVMISDYASEYWLRYTYIENVGGSVIAMDQAADQNFHVFKVYRESPRIAGFQVDNNPAERQPSNIPTGLMSSIIQAYGPGCQVIADWTRVRKWAGSDPVATPGIEQDGSLNYWTGAVDSDWNTSGNWSSGVPSPEDDVNIFSGANPLVITGTVECNNLTIEPLARVTVATTGDLTVNGVLTINSTGTMNSGSLINLGTVTGSVTYNRFLRPEDNFGERHFFSSPVSGQLISSFVSSNSPKVTAVWEWDEPTGLWPDITLTAGSLIPGKGYNLAQEVQSDGLLSFTGSLTDMTEPLQATSPYSDCLFDGVTAYADRPLASGREYGGGGWNLLGNPFASSMNISEFIATNTSSFDPNYQAVYIYDGTVTEHGTYYYRGSEIPGFPTGSLLYGSDYIQAGQGFFVLAVCNTSSFAFTDAMQSHQNTDPVLKSARVKNSWPGLQLRVKYGENESTTTVVFNENMTAGTDPGYDVGLLSASPDVEIYTALVLDNGINFARQALPLGKYEENIIPVGVNCAKGGEVTFSADVVPIRPYKFWLEDRKTGIFTDLNADTYTATLPENTYGTGRFYLYTATNVRRIMRPHKDYGDQLSLRIWTTSNNEVKIEGNVSSKAVCQVYDSRGQKIFETTLGDVYYNTISLPSVRNGTYLVKVTDGIKTITKKVVFL